MSNLIIDTSKLKDHHRENYVVKLRVMGMVLDYSIREKHILIQPIISLTSERTPIELKMGDDVQLSNPELCHVGTVIDAVCLYDGAIISILTIKVIDGDFNKVERRTLRKISNIKRDPL